MVNFVKIEPASIVGENVTVRLFRDVGGHVLGGVSSVGTGQGGDEEASTEGDDPPIEFALRIARELATAKQTSRIDIVDPDGLWDRHWGDLTTS